MFKTENDPYKIDKKFIKELKKSYGVKNVKAKVKENKEEEKVFPSDEKDWIVKFDEQNYQGIINIKEMVQQNIIIPLQYEDITISGNTTGLHNLCHKIDRYILHIIEEITEFNNEIKNWENENDPEFFDDGHSAQVKFILKSEEDREKYHNLFEELVDVINYTTSLISIFLAENFGLENVKNWTNMLYLDNYEITTDIGNLIVDYDDWNYANPFIKQVTSNIIDGLINNIRMNFPERKWHKDTNRILSARELVDLYDKCIKSCLDVLKIEIALFLYISDNDCKMLNDIFRYKIGLIHSLKEKRD